MFWVASGLFGADRYPFRFLTFVVSLEAMFVLTFVMIAQNRQAAFQQAKALRTGQVGVDFRVRDVDGSVDRLVDDLLASASLLAAAHLIARKSGPTVGGVSVAGLAVVGVGAKTWVRLAAKRPGRKPFLQRARAVSGLRAR